jgi:hypothetical protein
LEVDYAVGVRALPGLGGRQLLKREEGATEPVVIRQSLFVEVGFLTSLLAFFVSVPSVENR